MLGRPVVSVTSALLEVIGGKGRRFRLAYVAGGAGARVRLDGRHRPGPVRAGRRR